MRLLVIFLLFISLGLKAQTQSGTFSFDPSSFEENETVTLTVSGVDPQAWGVSDLYLWAWYFKNNSASVSGDALNNGTWDNSNEAQKLTNNGDGTYSFTFIPTQLFNDTNITRMGVLVKAKDGTGDKKSQDFLYYVGTVQVDMIAPSAEVVVLNSGDDLEVKARSMIAGSPQVGDVWVYFNNQLIASGQGYPVFTAQISNITQSGIVKVESRPFGETDIGEATIEVIVSPTVASTALPSDSQDGINYHQNDATKATLVLSAPTKDFVYLAGSFNNFDPSEDYLMNQDPVTGKFWLELNNLTPNQIYTYQYWVYDVDPVTNSPQIVKTADPYSTLVLSPFDDEYIPATSYPNLPTYPTGQQREVTVLQTGQSQYNWQVPDFQKPAKEDLVIYELLIRDFDENRSFQDLIDRIDYFKNLNINAIELMPVMEFEGNESWGYNTAFHMALDKFYGTPNKFKELVDTFHQNGIAVILDLALNHAFGRAPGVRMWMDDPDNDGWGDPSSENPYFNEIAQHSYSVGSDFNHQSVLTKNFTKRVIKHWIEEYKIDGFRWDLTKGFTQNCTANDEGCTGSYQQDRVDVLKEYADYSWSIDPDHYVIFEHLGGQAEEEAWADYRLSEGKGIMLWGNMFSSYKQLSMGYGSGVNIDYMRSESRNFDGKRLVGYPESHDEERLMYENLQYGNQNNPNHNVQNLNVALSRMSAIGAVSLLVPGPKMIWHFAELGMQQSLNTCSDGTVGDCRLDTKPQPQWSENWLSIAQRKQIYDDWAKMIALKTNNPVFRASSSVSPYNNNNLLQRIYIYDDALDTSSLKNVVILANFDVYPQTITADFPYTGTWYNLMDNSSFSVSNTATAITLQPGEFRVYGNQQATLGLGSTQLIQGLQLTENPVRDNINILLPAALKGAVEWKIYNPSGVLIDKGEDAVRSQYLHIHAPKQNGLYFVVLNHPQSNAWGLLKVLKQ
ncbi:MAG: alpha-amylase family glycosyl hydrolase [Flavobacteriaceae bacterium]